MSYARTGAPVFGDHLSKSRVRDREEARERVRVCVVPVPRGGRSERGGFLLPVRRRWVPKEGLRGGWGSVK